MLFRVYIERQIGRALLWWRKRHYRRKIIRSGLRGVDCKFEGLSIHCFSNEKVPPHNAVEGRSETPIILLHGFLDSSLSFRRLVADLAPHYRLYLIDIPGFGHSRMPAIRELWHIDRMAHILARFIFLRLGLTQVKIVAHSMGGLVAAHLWEYQRQHINSAEIESLHLIAPGMLQMEASDRDRIRQSFYPSSLSEIRQLLQNLSGLPKPLPPRVVLRALLADWSWQGYEMLALNTIERETEVFWSSERCRGLNLPVYLYWGHKDQILGLKTAHKLHSALPNSSLHILEEAGHVLHLDQSAVFTQRLRENIQ